MNVSVKYEFDSELSNRPGPGTIFYINSAGWTCIGTTIRPKGWPDSIVYGILR